NGKVVLIIHNHDLKNSLVTIEEPGREGIERKYRTHLRLENVGERVSAILLASTKSVDNDSQHVNSVQLTTTKVDHQPVLRNANLNIFIPSLDAAEFQTRLRSFPYGQDIANDQNATLMVHNRYDQCMQEEFLLRQELDQNLSDQKISIYCLSASTLDYTAQKIAQNAQQSQVFHQCLYQVGILVENDSIQELSREQLYKDDLNDKLARCEKTSKEFVVRQQLDQYLSTANIDTDESCAPLRSGIIEKALDAYRDWQ